jgi:hypothetical protein
VPVEGVAIGFAITWKLRHWQVAPSEIVMSIGGNGDAPPRLLDSWRAPCWVEEFVKVPC